MMPNWCKNYIVVSHADDAMMEKLVDGYNNDQLLETFYPIESISDDVFPSALLKLPISEIFNPHKAIDRASYGWGTKWDTGKSHGCEYEMGRASPDGPLYAFFDC